MKDVKKIIEKKISEISNEESTILVLKGIDIKLLYNDLNINIEKIIDNKLLYFMNIVQNNRKVITYDEYLALYNLVSMQYKRIIILENNMFINYYPLYSTISEKKLCNLLNHYDDEKEGDKYEIGGIDELTSIYGNIKLINSRYYIIYNNIVSSEKEEKIDIFEKIIINIEKEEFKVCKNCYEINDEEDYLAMLDDLLNNHVKTIQILEKNVMFNKIILEDKIKVLKYVFGDSVEIKVGFIKEKVTEEVVRQEYLDILKKYWGYNSFRKMKVYNLNKLNNKQKAVEEISQSNIISNIIDESEKCMNKKDYRDIFVTAPTGAGKSIIFQIPAIYLAEKYELFTIVISPLIGLMKDQVANLELRNYKYARTINSDISPIQKQEIINDIVDRKCNILYLSPESLLSKSDLDQIIGNRTLGLLIIDEAHIVTTWGKQFRPDYWYLGDHLSKIKKAQLKKDDKGNGFVIATFTATAIYGGIENMYEETIQSLKMVDPITYLGYVKRSDININIENTKEIKEKTEYELNKFDHLIEKMNEAMIMDKKMLIYFPTVALINRFWDYCAFKNMRQYVSRYHGQLSSYDKEESYKKFLDKETPIMLATKAFGMGIDIDDIEIVAHFSPTGNVCDYVQEIGRAARKPDLIGEAYYKFMKNDFKHINRLHGLSVIKKYQLIEVIRKIYELHQENIKNSKLGGRRITKKRNEMLVDAESFSHIFENPFFSEDDGINKVKTALLLIQKDFERKFSFSPFHVRPIPLFEIGFFKIELGIQKSIKQKYGNVLQEIDSYMHICSVNLKKIWEKNFNDKYSFPKFKYMLYTKDSELFFEYKDNISSALSIDIDFYDNYLQNFENYINAIKTIVNRSIREEKFCDVDGLVDDLKKQLNINMYKAKSIIDTIISAMSVYQRDYSKNIYAKMFIAKLLKSGEVKYKFMNGTSAFFRWIENCFYNIRNNVKEGTLYLIDETGSSSFKETLLILGILEILDLLVFKALGGKNSQIYVYVNQTKTMKEIIDNPSRYNNKLLELVSERHEISVEMLTYIFEGGFTNEEIWNLIEDYFLGIIPKDVIKNYEKKTNKKLEC
ncbi:DEAD/DEAH box helicase [Clostridium paraputrificum]|uniref:DEAD/DEAH box helicase n=7 Tax=Clostridium paraputrificum TaxID=29363 RepID=UPI0034A325FF